MNALTSLENQTHAKWDCKYGQEKAITKFICLGDAPLFIVIF
jgi:hypothetical protein